MKFVDLELPEADANARVPRPPKSEKGLKLGELDVPNAKELAWLAAVVAIEAPLYLGDRKQTKVSTETIRRLRWALDDCGIDWRQAVPHRRRIEREQRAAAYQRYLEWRQEEDKKLPPAP